MNKIVILTGYTGVGKTAISIELAKALNAEIISCDSLLVYKHLNIGTAKPTAEEQQIIPHHCIDIAEPDTQFDVQQYISYAKKAVTDIFDRKKNVLVVGGTGFYLKSFFSPVIDDIRITPEADQFVDMAIKNHTPEILVQKLLDLNDGQVDIDLKNIRRVSSALKRCLSSNMTCTEIKNKFHQQQSAFARYKKFTVLLTREDTDLKIKIRHRIETMLKSGLIAEVEQLLKNKQFNDINRTAIGYRETIQWLSDKTSTEDLLEKIYHDTWKLVKKQKTWFKKQIPIDCEYNISNQSSTEIIRHLLSKTAFFFHV